MRNDWAKLFPFRPGPVMFNHASFGVATRALLTRTQQIREELELDPGLTFGEPLLIRMGKVIAALGDRLGLDPEFCALTNNATAGAAAVQRSLPLSAGEVVIALDCEYASVLSGWRRRCDEVGAELRIVPARLPFDDVDALLDRMSTVAGSVAVLQFSAVTSSSALRLPVSRLAAWGRERGARVVVDAAHGPGHLDVSGWDDVDVVFGTMHKWFPVPRSVGLLWTTSELADRIRPAETSLTWEMDSFATNFGWPGTFDPANRLCLPEALAIHQTWSESGDLRRCEELADHATDVLTAAGAVPTAGRASLRPPRLRCFLLQNVSLESLRQRLFDADIRAWTGVSDQGSSLLRIATHVYNDEDDVARVGAVVRALVRV